MGDGWRDSFAPRGPPGLSSPVNTWRATATGEVAEVAGLRPRGFWARRKVHEFRQDRQIFLSKRRGREGTVRYASKSKNGPKKEKGRRETEIACYCGAEQQHTWRILPIFSLPAHPGRGMLDDDPRKGFFTLKQLTP